MARKNQFLLKIKKLTVLQTNKIINEFLLTGDIFMLELHLKQSIFVIFTYSACGPFTQHRGKIKKFRGTGNLKRLYRNELGKAFLLMMQHILKVNIYPKQIFQVRF